MINIGMPKSEVTMPMGISKVKMSREKLSQKSRNIAPIIAELARTARLSAPKIKRAMCGTNKPDPADDARDRHAKRANEGRD